jgi:hypothetical protein
LPVFGSCNSMLCRAQRPRLSRAERQLNRLALMTNAPSSHWHSPPGKVRWFNPGSFLRDLVVVVGLLDFFTALAQAITAL